jgi:hypothetical protein
VFHFVLPPESPRPHLGAAVAQLQSRAGATVERACTGGPGDAFEVTVLRAAGRSRVALLTRFDPAAGDPSLEPCARRVAPAGGRLAEALGELGFAEATDSRGDPGALAAILPA